MGLPLKAQEVTLRAWHKPSQTRVCGQLLSVTGEMSARSRARSWQELQRREEEQDCLGSEGVLM